MLYVLTHRERIPCERRFIWLKNVVKILYIQWIGSNKNCIVNHVCIHVTSTLTHSQSDAGIIGFMVYGIHNIHITYTYSVSVCVLYFFLVLHLVNQIIMGTHFGSIYSAFSRSLTPSGVNIFEHSLHFFLTLSLSLFNANFSKRKI